MHGLIGVVETPDKGADDFQEGLRES